MIKWIKLYKTGSEDVVTFNVESENLQSAGGTHEFTSPEDAQAKSTSEVLILWDGKLVGQGSLAA